MGALVDPLLRLPVSKEPLFWVAVWMAPAVFRQATRCPTLTTAGSGENDMLPFSATIEIVTSAVPPPPPPLGGGGFVTPPPPPPPEQDTKPSAAAARPASRVVRTATDAF